MQICSAEGFWLLSVQQSSSLSAYETAIQNENHSTISNWCIAHLVSPELWNTRHELEIPDWEVAQQLFQQTALQINYWQIPSVEEFMFPSSDAYLHWN